MMTLPSAPPSSRPCAPEAALEADLDRLFRALANRHRRAMLDRLAGGPAKVTDLAAPFAMALPSASKHIRVLEQAGLVRRAIDGRVHRCTLDPAALEVVETWLAGNRRLWRATLQSLARFAEDGGEGG